MKITREVPGILSLNETGNMNGAVAIEKSYRFFIDIHKTDNTKCVFRVQGKLNIEYDAGGSVEVEVEQNHLLEDFHINPDVDTLTKLVLGCPPRFNKLMKDEGLLDQDVWHTPSYEDTLDAIQDEIVKFYPLN